eukprot:4739531-Pleurochrysis_carterae.AAC.1
MHQHGQNHIRARAKPSAHDVNGHPESGDHAARDLGLPAASAIQRLHHVPGDAAMPREVKLVLRRGVDVHGGT